jgi:hypothetical protein
MHPCRCARFYALARLDYFRHDADFGDSGGEGGIQTPETLTGLTVFKTVVEHRPGIQSKVLGKP